MTTPTAMSPGASRASSGEFAEVAPWAPAAGWNMDALEVGAAVDMDGCMAEE